MDTVNLPNADRIRLLTELGNCHTAASLIQWLNCQAKILAPGNERVASRWRARASALAKKRAVSRVMLNWGIFMTAEEVGKTED